MEKNQSVLGPMEARKKTDLRLPYSLTVRMKELADAIGVPANAVYAMAAAQYVAELSRLDLRTKRDRILSEMEKTFQKIVAEARKVA
jgi:hypothetical protein